MHIASFDIGIKNMAFVVIDHDLNIIEWDVILLSSKNVYDIASEIIKTFDEKFAGKQWEYILLENQPCFKAPTMKSIQMILFTYFKIKFPDANVLMVSAMNKLCVKENDNVKNNSKLSYKDKKKLSVELTNKYTDVFSKLSKKDDICDAFLQAVAYVERVPRHLKFV